MAERAKFLQVITTLCFIVPINQLRYITGSEKAVFELLNTFDELVGEGTELELYLFLSKKELLVL